MINILLMLVEKTLQRCFFFLKGNPLAVHNGKGGLITVENESGLLLALELQH